LLYQLSYNSKVCNYIPGAGAFPDRFPLPIVIR
jgi:hypothetical protein